MERTNRKHERGRERPMGVHRQEPPALDGAILVVDAEPEVRELVARRLGSLGQQALSAASVPEAIALLETRRIAAVVSDHSLPGVTGLDLLSYVRRRLPRIPFFLMSDQLSPELEGDARSGGAEFAFAKDELLRALPDLLLFVRQRPVAAVTWQGLTRSERLEAATAGSHKH